MHPLKKALTATLIGNKVLFASMVMASEPAAPDEKKGEVLPEIMISAEKIITPAMQASETVYTGSEITAKALRFKAPRRPPVFMGRWTCYRASMWRARTATASARR